MTFIKGHSYNKGKHPSEETRKKMSERMMGKKLRLGKKHTKTTREKISKKQTGKKQSIETCRKRSLALSGKKCYNWKGGVNPKNDTIRKSFEYKLWRTAVFERDKYTCIWCDQVGGDLEADHILPFADYPEHRFSIDNGRTLCKNCHKKRHKKN